jgi:hypothetical protein
VDELQMGSPVPQGEALAPNVKKAGWGNQKIPQRGWARMIEFVSELDDQLADLCGWCCVRKLP